MSTGIDSVSNVEDTLADDRQARKRSEAHAIVGEKIGRYVVLHHVGSGGMGVVYGAYDPELDRKVALKLLHRGPSDDIKLQTRLLREAQAMARLSHPQVVTVHDVGTHEDQIFVAMEFIEGHILGAWLREDTRSWAEITAVFSAAGEGLMAAHVAGLVHRDFKPDNVLVGHDGQVRVVDFGLVQTSGETRSAVSESVDLLDSTPSLLESLDAELTRTGAMLGTPAYMSPEQFSRLPLDARSDQFSFCAALYEALYKQRPFAAPSLPALVTAVIERIASVFIDQANHIGYGLARPEEGQRLLGYARATLVSHEVTGQEARIENTLGLFAYARGDNDLAITHFERVHELRAAQWGDDHPQTANILNNLGAIAFAKSDYPSSRAYHERTLAI